MDQPDNDDAALPAGDLSHAGAVVDQAIGFMVKQELESLAIASALLGGALGVMARSMQPAAIVAVLENALAATRRGELHEMAPH